MFWHGDSISCASSQLASALLSLFSTEVSSASGPSGAGLTRIQPKPPLAFHLKPNCQELQSDLETNGKVFAAIFLLERAGPGSSGGNLPLCKSTMREANPATAPLRRMA